MRFQDRVVIVTGASRGIGKGIAEAFAGEGAKVACVASTEANAERTASTLAGARAYGCDLGDGASIESCFAKIQEEMGTPWALVNNAGVTKDQLMMRMSEDDFDRVIDVNLKAAFLTTKAVLRTMMKAREGRIVNLSSINGLHGAAGQANYAASKAGLIGLTRSTAKELGSRGITCNVVAPGFIQTDMTEELPEEMKENVKKSAPAGRLGTPEDIAAAVLFLSSPEASYITGQVLVVDGGLTM